MQALEIFALAALFAALTALTSRALGTQRRIKQIQQEVAAYQRELKQALKSCDEAKLRNLKAREPHITALMRDMLLLPMKSSIIIIPIFLVALWFVTAQWPAFTIRLPIALHPHEVLALQVFQESTYGPRGWFIISAIICGIAIECILRLLKK